MNIRATLFFVVLTILWAACNLEKEIEVDLPDYAEELVVECYLEPGEVYRMTLTTSLEYFSNVFVPAPINGAIVKIKHQGNEILLSEAVVIDTNINKVFNYVSDEIVPSHYNEDFDLEITLANGDIISSKTQILEPVPIDSLVLKFRIEEDTSALLFTYFEDMPNKDNFYRRMLHFGSSIKDAESLEQDFYTDDEIFDGETVVFGTGFNYAVGDTLIASLFHIDEGYFDYLESVDVAVQSNGNPFGSPASIRDNIENGTGIFTGLSYVRDTVIVTF